MSSASWPSASGSGIDIYANVAAFPTSGNVVGQCAVDASNPGTIYQWNGSAWLLTASTSDTNGITAITGDGTATGPVGGGSAALTLSTVNASPGSFGSASTSLTATVTAKGLISALSSQNIQITESQVTSLTSDLALKAPLASPTFTGTVTIPSGAALATPTTLVGTNITGTAAGLTAGSCTTIPALTGDITSSGNATTLATVNSNVGAFGTASQSLNVTANAKGLITALSAQSIQIAESQVTSLVSDLALKAPLAGPTFTGTVTIPSGAVLNTPTSMVGTNITGLPLTTGVTGILPVANGGTGLSALTTIATTLTTKGDLQGYSTTNARIPAGTNGQRPIADSNATLGIRYQDSFPKNYILESDLGLNATTGYAVFADAASNIPVDGTGGSPVSTIAVSTSTPLNGGYMFTFTKAGSANRQGEGWSYDFSIDQASQGRVVAIQLNYKVISGTFTAADGITPPLNDGTTTTNAGNSDLEFFLYDVTNAVLIPVTPQVLVSNSTVSAPFKGTFQAASNSTSYRLICYQATATTNNYVLGFSQIFVGELPVCYGFAGTDRSPYVPTINGAGTISHVNIFSKRLGEDLLVEGDFQCGTTTGSTAYITLPPGLSIDYSKLDTTITQLAGAFATMDSTGPSIVGYRQLFVDGSTLNQIFFTINTGSNNFVKTNGSSLWSNSVYVTLNFRVPILGWSSNVLMSNDTDTRVVDLIAYKNGGSVTANTNISGWTTQKDTHGAFDGTTYIIPVSGDYDVSFFYQCTSTCGSSFIFKNGAVAANATGASNGLVTLLPDCIAGDRITVQQDTSTTASSNTTGTKLCIARKSGPASIAASASVCAKYSTGATQTINTTESVINYSTQIYDTTGSVTVGASWNFKAPISGKYRVSALNALGAQTFSAGNRFITYFQINGVTNGPQVGSAYAIGGISMGLYVGGSSTFDLLAGNTIAIGAITTGGLSSADLEGYAGDNYICIERVGN